MMLVLPQLQSLVLMVIICCFILLGDLNLTLNNLLSHMCTLQLVALMSTEMCEQGWREKRHSDI